MDEIEDLRNKIRELRRRERMLNRRAKSMRGNGDSRLFPGASPSGNIPDQGEYGFQNIGQLRRDLKRNLPSFMMPSNIGRLQDIAWPYWEQVNFDFGTNPTVGTATRQTQSFQVDQEASILLMSVTHTASSYDTAGYLGPWVIDFRDRQSSRQFNDNPVPIQTFGTKGLPSILPTPMLLMPNAFFDVVMSTFVTTNQTLSGTSLHQFSFFGYRVRVQDADRVLGTIFDATVG